MTTPANEHVEIIGNFLQIGQYEDAVSYLERLILTDQTAKVEEFRSIIDKHSKNCTYHTNPEPFCEKCVAREEMAGDISGELDARSLNNGAEVCPHCDVHDYCSFHVTLFN